MLAADPQQSHGQVEFPPDRAVAIDELDIGVTAVAARQLGGVPVRLSSADCLIEYPPAHPTSTPETQDRDARYMGPVNDRFPDPCRQLAARQLAWVLKHCL